MDINSRVGNHTENVMRSEALVVEHLEKIRAEHPKFDFAGGDYCHCATNRVEATLEFDGFLRLVHVDCGKILIDGTYEGEMYMPPVQVHVEHGVTPGGDHYLYLTDDQDCGV